VSEKKKGSEGGEGLGAVWEGKGGSPSGGEGGSLCGCDLGTSFRVPFGQAGG